MTQRTNAREIVLLDEVVLIATGTHEFRGLPPLWGINPRFVLVLSDLTAGAGASLELNIEHSMDGTNVFDLYAGFAASAEGAYRAYTEDLATRYPFARLRANVTTFADITSVTATLLGFFDKGN